MGLFITLEAFRDTTRAFDLMVMAIKFRLFVIKRALV